MRKIFFYIVFSLATTSAFAEIMNIADRDKLIKGITQDRLIDTMMIWPTLAYTDKVGEEVYPGKAPAQGNMEFVHFGIKSYTLVSGTATQSSTDALVPINPQSLCGAQSELVNKWNESPGATNVTQTLSTASCTRSYSTSATTSTTCGWSTTVGYKYSTTVGAEGAKSTNEVSVAATVNGSSTVSETTTDAIAYTSPQTQIIVPAGCKAVVLQTLDKVDFSGKYTFNDKIKDGVVKFTTRKADSYNSSASYTNTGYVRMVDLIFFGSPTPVMTIESVGSDNVLLQGSGTFKATGYGDYHLSYYFDEADVSHPHCNSSMAALTEQTNLLKAQDGHGFLAQQRDEDGRIIYTATLPIAKKDLGTNVYLEPAVLTSGTDTGSCWAAM